MLDVKFEGESIREAIAKLKDVDPDLKKMLMKDLKSAIKPVATAVANSIPSEPPLSGMGTGFSRLRWGTFKATVSVTPGKKRGDTRLVSIVVTGNPDAGFKLAELAGSRGNYGSGLSKPYKSAFGTKQHTLNGQGENLVRVLRQRFPTPGSGKGGRFAYMKFREEKPQVARIAVELIDKHLEDVNRKF